jgi:ketosteroid isomerase-like protein
MRNLEVLAFPLMLGLVTAGTSTPARFDPETIIALERAALDRWGKGDPEGYLETYAPEITYFDPAAERRVNGLAAMRALYEPIAGKVRIERYEMIEPRVQHDGDMAVLSYNLVSHARRSSGDSIVVRWNSTAVYRRISGRWKMIHSHWSYTKPEVKTPISEVGAGPNPQDLVGTWQLMTVKNLRTGEVDSVATHSLAWIIYAPTQMSFTFMRKNRAGGMSPEDFAKLSPAERAKTYHSWAWTEANVQQFGGLASTWRLSGNTITYGSEMRLNPYRAGREFSETIVHLDGSTLVVRTDVTGEPREETSRRINGRG